MADISQTVWVVGFAFLVAGFVKGVTGMGLPPVAIGIMAVAIAPLQAAALVVVPATLTNVWQMLFGPGLVQAFKRFWLLLALMCLGVALGVGVLTGGGAGTATLVLGFVLFVYALLGLFKFHMQVPARREPVASPVVGVLTGFLAGATGVSSVPSAPYLNSLGLSKEALLQALGLVFTVGTAALGVGLYLKGQFQFNAAWESTLCLVPTVLGMLLGQRCRAMLSPEKFKTVFFWGLLILGAYMIFRALRVVWLG